MTSLTGGAGRSILGAMNSNVREIADAKLDAGFEALELEDARPHYRNHMRRLRDRDPASFERASRHYQEGVVPRLAAGESEPVTEWVEYGRFMAELEGSGRTMEIETDGRAVPYRPPVRKGALILFVPDRLEQPALVLARPKLLSAPQQATLDLLAP